MFSRPRHEILSNLIFRCIAFMSIEYKYTTQTLIPYTYIKSLPLPRLPTPRTRRRRHLPPSRLLRRLHLLLHNHSRSLFPSTRFLRSSRSIFLINLSNQRNLSRKPLLKGLSDEEAISVEPAREWRR